MGTFKEMGRLICIPHQAEIFIAILILKDRHIVLLQIVADITK